MDDLAWMDYCLQLARRGRGYVSPNPEVGAVLVLPDGRIAGEGYHTRYGEPHAEPNAIRDALSKYGPEVLRQCTLYVNLEPCSHYGKTPPCADTLIEAGIPRVVIGTVDPNPRVAGTGIERLRRAGIEVTVGVQETACRRQNEGFIRRMTCGMPLITLKTAATINGMTATATGESRWISGEESRARVHRWRAESDAVLIGAGTAAADNPSLTVRHLKGRQPYRIVLDRQGELSTDLTLFTDRYAERTVVITATENVSYLNTLAGQGVHVYHPAAEAGHLDLRQLLADLAAGRVIPGRPLQYVLVEAGPRLAGALLEQDLIDRLAIFLAPKIILGGRPIAEGSPTGVLAEALTFAERKFEPCGSDLLYIGYRRTV